MEDDLPTEFDVIVVGTGMTESIVAAAASRIGKKVLHLDSNEYYGGLWASFNFEGLQKWMEDCLQPAKIEEQSKAASTNLKEGETLIKAGNQFSTVFNIEEKWYILEEVADSSEGQSFSRNTQTDGDEQGKGGGDVNDAKKEEDAQTEKHEGEESDGEEPDAGDGKEIAATAPTKQWSQSKLKKEYRKFNLDLAPKLLFARGSLVELLISSNIARYAEFRSVTRVLTWLNGRLEPVPCSRADVFATHHVTVVEKRMLMKLLTMCMEYENTSNEFEGFEDKTFLEYLKSKKLTPNLLHYVLHAIAMATDSTPCMEGVSRTQRFLNSLGRYGNTPFLWPMYGSGEIPQCFCRLCAVFGGLYHLKRAAEAVIVNNEDAAVPVCKGIVSGGQRLETLHLVMGVGYAPPQYLQTAPSGGLSRGIFITDRSILPADKESLTLLQFPPVDGCTELVTVIEVGPQTNACPLGLYVVHMTCKQQKTAKEDLQGVTERLLHVEFSDGSVSRIATDTQSTQTVSLRKQSQEGESEEGEEKEGEEKSDQATALKPQVLWSLFFNCPETSGCDLTTSVPANVYLCSGPDLDLDFEYAVQQAKEIFSKMYPESEFLPRAPDPEELVLEGEEGTPGPTFEGDIGKGETEGEDGNESKAEASNGEGKETQNEVKDDNCEEVPSQ